MEKNNKKQINSNRPINFIFILISQFSNVKLLNQTYETQQSIILANFQHYRPLSSTERQRQIIKRNKFRVPEDRILHEHVRMSFLMRHSEVDKTEMTCADLGVEDSVLREDFVVSLHASEVAIIWSMKFGDRNSKQNMK